MELIIHRATAIIAICAVSLFIGSTVIAEITGNLEIIIQVKQLIVMPGLLVLVPAVIGAGISGAKLAKNNQGNIVKRKRKRMPWIAINGVGLLIPCALILSNLAVKGELTAWFYGIQAVELVAGGVNLTLMVLNLMDGKKLGKKLTRRKGDSYATSA